MTGYQYLPKDDMRRVRNIRIHPMFQQKGSVITNNLKRDSAPLLDLLKGLSNPNI
jgi:hypothetical protein